MLLTNLPVENLKDAQRILRYYARRRECEEEIRFLKSNVNLENIRTFHWSAIYRLVLLVVLVMAYLCWIMEVHPHVAERPIRLDQPLADKSDLLQHRLLTGIKEAINTYFGLICVAPYGKSPKFELKKH